MKILGTMKIKSLLLAAVALFATAAQADTEVSVTNGDFSSTTTKSITYSSNGRSTTANISVPSGWTVGTPTYSSGGTSYTVQTQGTTTSTSFNSGSSCYYLSLTGGSGGSSSARTYSSTDLIYQGISVEAGTYSVSAKVYASVSSSGVKLSSSSGSSATATNAFYMIAGSSTSATSTISETTSAAGTTISQTVTMSSAGTLYIGIGVNSLYISSSSYTAAIYVDDFTVVQTSSSSSSDSSSTTTSEFDSSNYFSNLDFQSCPSYDSWYSASSIPGWTLQNSSNSDLITSNWVYFSTKGSVNTSNEACGVFDTTSANYNYQCKVYNATTSYSTVAENVLYQSAYVPAGSYTISVDAFAMAGSAKQVFALFATDGSQTVNSNITATTWTSSPTKSTYTVNIELSEPSTLTFGICINSTSKISAYSGWMNFYADDFKVTGTVYETEDEEITPAVGTVGDDVVRVVGADISLIPAYEDAGDIWLDNENNAIEDLVEYLAEQGLTAARVRLMVDPSTDGLVATCQDLDYVTALGKRIKAAGMYFLLDIFYSDTWTDVSKQWIPSDWNMSKSTTTANLAAQVKEYTISVLNTLCDAGATPDYIQLGNEVTYGMLWDNSTDKSTDLAFYPTDAANYSSKYADNVARFATLLNAAAAGVRASEAASAKIILHSERLLDAAYSTTFYNWVETNNFTDYDIIGLSYYPAWQGTLNQLKLDLNALVNAYPAKEIQIVETAYYNSSKTLEDQYLSRCTWGMTFAGQAQFVADLVEVLNQYNNVTGVYYWQPEECGSGADSQSKSTNTVMDAWDQRGWWPSDAWGTSTHSFSGYDTMCNLLGFNNTGLASESTVDVDDSVTTTTTDISATAFDNLDFETYTTGTYENTTYVATEDYWTENYDIFGEASGDYYSLWYGFDDTYMSSLIENCVFKFWLDSSIGATAGTLISQSTTEELPAGTYYISVVAHCDGTDQLALFATAGETTLTTAFSNQGSGTWSSANVYQIVLTLTEPSTITIGLTLLTDVAAGTEINLYADNFKVLQKVKTVEATITAAGYATYYNKYALQVPEGVEATTITAVNNGALTMAWDYTEGTIVPAGTALLLKGEEGTYTFYISDADTAAPTDNMLYGSVEEVTSNVDGATTGYKFYMLSYDTTGTTLGFYYGATDGAAFTSEAYKCWLAVDSSSSSAKLRGFAIERGDDDTTGIEMISSVSDNTIYNLAGQRVNATAKGLYIVGGKKIVK